MGMVLLAVTGCEALYADIGHFGREPLQRAWFIMVYPALTLNYLGQGALVLDDRRRSTPLLPHGARSHAGASDHPGDSGDDHCLPGHDHGCCR